MSSNKTTSTDDNSRIAVINTNIGYIQRDILDIKTVLKEGYATKASVAEIAKDTEKRLVLLESKENFWKFFSPTLAAVMGSIMTFFIMQYFINLRR